MIFNMAIKQMVSLVLIAALMAVANAFINPKKVAWDPDQAGEGEMNLSVAMSYHAETPVLWVDARTQADFDKGHIPNAVLLNEDDWENLLTVFFDNWDGVQRIVVYCSSGGCQASHQVADRIRDELGIEDVWVLHRGWEAWEEAQ